MIEDNDNRAYTARHVWVLPAETGRKAYVGMTDFLTEELQAIVGVDLPMVGDELDIQFCIHLHMVADSSLAFPLTGRVLKSTRTFHGQPESAADHISIGVLHGVRRRELIC